MGNYSKIKKKSDLKILIGMFKDFVVIFVKAYEILT